MGRSFAGKTVLVTGAAAGLGRALCHRFARAGARVGGLDVDATGLAQLERELDGSSHAVAVADLAEGDAVEGAVAALVGRIGPVDTLVNNAGITHIRAFAPGEEAAVRRVMEVNFLGAVHATGACLRSIVERRGSIITISSVAGFAPLLGRSGYCASKHALHGFFDTLRLELRHTGVGVLVVCPSYIATDIRAGQDGGDAPVDDGRSRVVGRQADPAAVADAVVRAAERGRRQLHVGRVGVAAHWLRRLAPRLYEHLMLRRVRDE
ncbi:MAG: SDR family oxidoreductase [Holophagales bacterium]|nr:SDR family oxidoreductase [Holophagales bacterium]